MKNNNSTDRRIFARIPIMLPIRFLASGQEKEHEAKTVDVSANGIGFLSKGELSPLTPLEMWLQLPENRGTFYTRGKVVWSSPTTETGEQRNGIRLEKAELMGLAPVLWR